MRRIPIIAATAALALLLVALFATPSPAANAAPVSAGSHLHIIDLGTLGSPQDSSQAIGINNRGDVIGWSDIQSCFCSHAFLWRHGKMTDLAPLTAANDINDNGVIAGAGGTASGYRAFRWAHGKALNLGTLGGDFSQALGINNRGQIVGISATATGYWHPFLWYRGKMTDLAPLASAVDINDQGQIAGSYQPPGSENTDAVLYRLRDRKLTDLGNLYGWFSQATKLNERGQVVGYVGVATLSGANSAFFWSKGHMTDLGTMGGDFSQALGINDRGTVVGAGQVPSVGYRGFVWRNGVMTPLSVLPAGNSSIAYDINNQGVIVGSSGIDPNNSFYHAVLWR